jgi:hypothetical protein
MSKLDENIKIAEKLFLLSEEIRDMVNTFDLVAGRRCIVNAVVDVIMSYNIEQQELNEALFCKSTKEIVDKTIEKFASSPIPEDDPVLTDFENMEF